MQFKYTIVVVALAVSARLAASVPAKAGAAAPATADNANTQQEPSMAATNMMMMGPKKMPKSENMMMLSDVKEVREDYSSNDDGGIGGGLIEAGMLSLLESLSTPKKLIGTAIGFFIGKLKSVDFKKLMKTALISALVTILGTVAVVAIAGLVSVVSGICALIPYFKLLIGKNHNMSESQLDTISNFVLDAFSKYDKHH